MHKSCIYTVVLHVVIEVFCYSGRWLRVKSGEYLRLVSKSTSCFVIKQSQGLNYSVIGGGALFRGP